MKVQIVNSNLIRPLRHLVLRPNKPFSSTTYLKDNEKNTVHFAYIDKKRVLSCATFYPESHNLIKSKKSFRLRGMATHPDFRRIGCGKIIMIRSIDYLKSVKCEVIWCNARILAIDFYKSLGFEIQGNSFNIKDIGKHYFMSKNI